MYELLLCYLEKLPSSYKTVELPDGTTLRSCIFTPHSLSESTATMLVHNAYRLQHELEPPTSNLVKLSARSK
jgi:hypothetical protein